MRRSLSAIAAATAALAIPHAAAAAELAAEILPRTLKDSARERLTSAVDQFSSWHAWVEAVAAIALAVALASLLAWHPRARRPRAALDGEEERRTLIVLGMIGAIVASLVLVDQAMAFVVFGIGGLVRFRTILRTPQLTGKAILVIVIGLACGLTQYLMAVVVAVAAWLVIWWLNGSRPARVRIRVPAGTDLVRIELVAADALRRMRCKVASARLGATGRSVHLMVRIPTALEDEIVSRSLSATLAADLPRAEVEIVAS
ncbi:MAG: hypothetical protein ACKOYN_07915 [Planctomycetota bacterium]